MLKTFFKLDYEGKIFDRVASGDVDLGDASARIEFPAPYAHYAFTTHERDILNSAYKRHEAQMLADFELKYLENFSVREALHYASRRMLARMRSYELNAPGPRPPAKNPHRDRLRRITGRLSNTAFIPRIRQQAAFRRFEDPQRLTPGRRARLERRVTRRDRPRRVRLSGRY